MHTKEQRSDLLGGFALHVLDDVAVQVERDADVGVPEPFRHHLRMNAGRKRQRRGRVPEVVQGDGWQRQGIAQPLERRRERVRVQRQTIEPAEHEPGLGPRGTGAQSILQLSTAVRSQRVNGSYVERNRTLTPLRLRWMLGDPVALTGGHPVGPNGERCLVEIDRVPPQAGDLPASHPLR